MNPALSPVFFAPLLPVTAPAPSTPIIATDTIILSGRAITLGGKPITES